MGVGITDVTPENAKFFDVKDTNGAVVTQVEPDSPGAKAGLKSGDVITELNGKNVTDAGQLQMKSAEKPGSTMNLQVMRDGKNIRAGHSRAHGRRSDNTESASAATASRAGESASPI